MPGRIPFNVPATVQFEELSLCVPFSTMDEGLGDTFYAKLPFFWKTMPLDNFCDGISIAMLLLNQNLSKSKVSTAFEPNQPVGWFVV